MLDENPTVSIDDLLAASTTKESNAKSLRVDNMYERKRKRSLLEEIEIRKTAERELITTQKKAQKLIDLQIEEKTTSIRVLKKLESFIENLSKGFYILHDIFGAFCSFFFYTLFEIAQNVKIEFSKYGNFHQVLSN